METMALIYVGAGGAFGALLRYLCAINVTRLWGDDFPLATMLINISGSLLMGVWIALASMMLPSKAKDLHLLIAVGALGGFTTFSAFALDAFQLVMRGEWLHVAVYAFGSVLLSVAALMLGMWLVKWGVA
jgi:fluoride exporter